MEYLSEEWLAELARVGRELPEVAGVDLVIQHEVALEPKGKARYFTVIANGQIVEVGDGKNADAAVQVTVKQKEALRVLRGDLTPDVGFMQGRLKVDGDYRLLLDTHRGYRESEPYRAMWAHMAEVTD